MPDDEHPDPLEGKPEGFCRLASETHSIWFVRGRTRSYVCGADSNTCSCFDWAMRRAKSLSPCKHLRALAEWLRMQPCPLCEEEGCVGCAGMGRVPAEEHQALMEMSQERLKEVFA